MWTFAGFVAVAGATAIAFLMVGQASPKKDPHNVSVDQMLDMMVVESEDERLALQLILTGDPERVARGKVLLQEAALLGRPTAQRHLATFWALSDSPDRRVHVYQWLLVALACARGIDHQLGTDIQINYLLFLTNIALIEHSTSDRDKDLGRTWAKGWLAANGAVPALQPCDAKVIDDYRGD
jgi:hypothetical protein